MKTTEEDSEVFEITDFTTASEWERFIARLEEVFHEWKLTTICTTKPLEKNELTNGQWEEIAESLQFADFKFSVSLHRLKNKDGPSETGTAEKSETGGTEDLPRPESSAESDEGSVPVCWLDMMSVENDFPSRAHCLARWYGIRQFVIVQPANSSDSINTESRVNLLLSSISICLNNIGCQVPVFVQVHSKWRRFYLGQCEAPGFRTSFEMVHLKHAPPQYSHLAGLLDVFKGKLNSPISPLPPSSVSVRFTYVLQDWNAYNWSQAPPDMDSVMGAEVGCTEFGDLPFGACEDPVGDLHLSATWPSLSEEMIVDTDVYSDLDPVQAPHWNVRVRMTEDIQCLLGDYLEEFVQLCRRKESTDQLLGGIILDDTKDSSNELVCLKLTETDISQALQRLTEPVAYNLSSLGTVVTRATSKLQIRPEEAPIPADLLNEILLFLFPDARAEAEKEGSSDESSARTTPATSPLQEEAKKLHSASAVSQQDEQYKELFRQLKSAPLGSLTMKLSVCLCIVNHSYGGLRAVAHLWQEFVLEMRFRWENNYLIPELEAGAPNMGCSLLHQKLQMLNCCINHKISREALLMGGASARPESPTSVLSSSDDEFYDVDEDVNDKTKKTDVRRKDSKKALKDEANIKKAEEEKGISEKEKRVEEEMDVGEGDLDTSFKDSWTHQADGRLRAMENLYLLNGENRLYIPVTQQPAPMTEDLLDEHAEVLAKLGTSPEGAHLRARMQSACLLSDMEGFKAANPGCTLGDFVRWYSPRDWIEEEVTDEEGNVSMKGSLSQRMQIPGNMWVDVWQSAKPVPVRRQKRLFDDTKEAEKVLHFLAALKPSEVVIKMMPMVIHSAIVKILQQEESVVPAVQTLMNSILTKATKAMRAQRMDVKKFEELIRLVGSAEVMVTQAQSLKTKFAEEEEKIKQGSPSSSQNTIKEGEGEKYVLSKEVEEFITKLLEQPEVYIIGAARGPVGSVVHALFSSAQKAAIDIMMEDEEVELPHGNHGKDFPVPAAKEYIIRTTVPRPAPWSRMTPQRLFCVVMKDDFRLAGAFSSDTTFQ